MTTEQAFLRDIIDHPDDDTPRLIYADWLEDHGRQERGELIRVQCELAKLWPNVKAGRKHKPWRLAERNALCEALRRRERELLEKHELEWARPVAVLLGRGDSWQFCRGFVESVTCTAADWLTHADALTQATPLREVTLTTRPELRDFTDEYLKRDIPPSCRMERAAEECLRSFWPRIAFTLPPAQREPRAFTPLRFTAQGVRRQTVEVPPATPHGGAWRHILTQARATAVVVAPPPDVGEVIRLDGGAIESADAEAWYWLVVSVTPLVPATTGWAEFSLELVSHGRPALSARSVNEATSRLESLSRR